MPSPPQAARISRELRQGRGGHLRERRAIAALSLVSSAAMGVISLYQLGLIRHLPEPPLRALNADKVDASWRAYRQLSTPDAPLGLLSYAATLTLAAMQGENRARTHPWLPLALAGKVAVDAAGAAYLTWEQIAKEKSLCGYCLLAAAATFATVPLVVPEAREALRQLRRH